MTQDFLDFTKLSGLTGADEVDTSFQLDRAKEKNPDEYAKTIELSNQMGVSRDLIETDVATFEKNQPEKPEPALDGFLDFTKINSLPQGKTGEFIADFDNAVVAQDDIPTLEKIEKAFDATIDAIKYPFKTSGLSKVPGAVVKPADEKEGLLPTAQYIGSQSLKALDEWFNIVRNLPAGAVGGLGISAEGIGQTYKVAGRGVESVTGVDEMDTLISSIQSEPGKELSDSEKVGFYVSKLGDILKLQAAGAGKALKTSLDFIGDWFVNEGGDLKKAGDIIGSPEDRKNFATDVAYSLGILAEQITVGMVSRPASGINLFAMGVEQQSEKQKETGTLGKDFTSDLALLGGGGITLATEKLQMFNLLERLPPKIKGELKQKVADVALAGGGEAAQETIENLAHSVLELYTTNPDAELFEGLDRDASVAGVTGVIAKMVINAVVPGRQRNPEDRTNFEADQLDQLNQYATESNLKGRSKEKLKQFVDSVAGDDVTHVYIDGEKVSEFMQSKTQDEIDRSRELQILNEQWMKAERGEDVQIPIDDFMTEFTGTDTYFELKNNMTLNEDTVSKARLEQHINDYRESMKSLVEKAKESSSMYVEAQEAFNDVKTQLIETKRYSSFEADTLAKIVPAWVTVRAKDSGKTVSEVYREIGLKIEGPFSDRGISEQSLSQEPAYKEAPAVFDQVKQDFLDVISEDTNVNDVMDSADELSPEYKQVLTALDKADWLGFDTPAKAINTLFSEDATSYDVPQDLKSATGKLVNKVFGDTLKKEVTDNEILKQQPGDRGRSTTDQKLIEEATGRTEEQALAEFEKALRGEEVTVVHRSWDDVNQLDNAKLDTPDDKKTPSAFLGHYFGMQDVGNPQRHGNAVTVYKVKLKNPLVISDAAFESATDGLTYQEAMEKRKFFQEQGHDGILIEGLNWVILFDSSDATELQPDYGDVNDFFKQEQDVENLYLAHNLTESNIIHSDEMGGIAAPSLAIARTDKGFESFGEITLLSNNKLLNDRYARTFGADVYTPRYPKVDYKVNIKKFYEIIDPIKNELSDIGIDLRINEGDIESNKFDDLVYDTGLQYYYLKSIGKAPKLPYKKKKSLPAYLKKFSGTQYSIANDPEFEKAAVKYYTELAELRAKAAAKGDDNLYKVLLENDLNTYIDGDGKVYLRFINELAYTVSKSTGKKEVDTYKLDEKLRDKLKTKRAQADFRKWLDSTFSDVVEGERIFTGYTPSGNRRYIAHTLDNVVKLMTKKLRGGENFNYGPGTIRSALAPEFKTISKIKKARGKIVAKEEIEKLKEETYNELSNVADSLRPYYRYSDDYSYMNAVAENLFDMARGKGLPDFKDVPDDVRREAAEYLAKLRDMPTEYFETKIQRAVDIGEFDTAVVPKDISTEAKEILKRSGVKLRYYDPKVEGSRQEVIAKQKRLLFQEQNKGVRGYYDPVNNIIRLTESSNLSTFLHEFAHLMYETELRTDGKYLQGIHTWFKRNADDVAAEANEYLDNQPSVLSQQEPGIVELVNEGDVDKVETGKPVSFNFIHNTESATSIFGKPKKDDRFYRGFEPSARYVNVASKEIADKVQGTFISGKLTFNNPLVIPNNRGQWKKTLSEKYDGKTGKELSKALIKDGYDGVITTNDNYISEVVDFTTFDESKALFQKDKGNGSETNLINGNDVVTYLDNGTTGSDVKDAALRRATHEQFSRGFEKYLMEGKAPSIELRNVFRTFARWLVEVYRAVRGNLRVNLDDEMRKVFDRMIATEEQIQAAEIRNQVKPMFDEKSDITEEDLKDYNNQVNKIKDKQSETLRNKLIKELTRQTKAWWKTELQDKIDSELKKLKNLKIYKTIERLKRPANTTNSDLYLKSLKDQLDTIEKRINELKRNNDTVGQFLSKKGGLNREVMAAEGIDPAHFKEKAKVFGKPLFPKQGGMTPDDVAEWLNQEQFKGREDWTANEAVEVITDMLDDDTTYIRGDVDAEINLLYDQSEQIGVEIEQAEITAREANIKLDYNYIIKKYGVVNKQGNTVLPYKLRGMTVSDGSGFHPDEAAAILGYDSGDEMVQSIINSKTVRQQATENANQRMIEKYGDIFNDGTIEQEADEALVNEERGELLLKELRLLNKGKRVPQIDRATMKQLAIDEIGKLSYREINPGRYRRAEIKFARESERALANGDKTAAIEAKRKQVMNYYLGMVAMNAKSDIEKIVTFMGRYKKKSIREKIQRAGNDYWEQLTNILYRFEFRKTASLKEVESLNLWLKNQMEDKGDGLTLSAEVLAEGYRKHWKKVPYSELQGIRDSVKNIEHVASESNKVRLADEEYEFNNLVDQWSSVIMANSSGKFKTVSEREIAEDVKEETKGDVARRWLAQLSKIPFIAKWLDGGEKAGLSAEILDYQFTAALDEKYTLMKESMEPILKLINSRDPETVARHAEEIYIDEIGQNMTGGQIVAVALNTGNTGNLKKMLLGERWAETDEQVSRENPKLQAVLKHMTESDWEFVQTVWDQMQKLYPKLAEVHRRATGLVPPQVEATPFTVTINGKTIEMKGGYYPVKYSRKRSNRADVMARKAEAETEAMFTNQSSIQSYVNAGSTNERTGFYDKINLNLDVIPEHFNEVIHYISMYEKIRQTNKLINNPVIKDAIISSLGEAEYNAVLYWLSDIAKDGRGKPFKHAGDEIFQKFRLGVTVGTMGFKASTGIMQLFGLLTTAGELGFGPTMKAIFKTTGRAWFLKSVRKIFGSEKDIQTMWEFASEKSKVLNHRTLTMDREMKVAFEKIAGKRGVIPMAQQVSMMHIALIQTYTVDLPTWVAAYDKMISETGDESKAVKFADATVEMIQGSGETKNMAQLFRNQSGVWSSFTMFMTFFSSLGNLTRDLARGARSGRYNTVEIAAKLSLFYFIPVFLEALMRGELYDEDEDEPADAFERYLINVALYPLTSIPLFRDAASGLLTDYGYNSSPIASILEKGITSASSIFDKLADDGEITEVEAKNAAKLIAAWYGVPGVNQAFATGEHIYEVAVDGEDLAIRSLLFGPKR